MLDVGGRPFLAWLLREVCRLGLTDALILAGHLAEAIAAALPGILSQLPRPISVEISVEPVPAGTLAALHHARARLQPRFLLLNGDSWFECDLAPALSAPPQPGLDGTLMLRHVPDASRFGVVEVAGNRITRFRERPDGPGPGLVYGGASVLSRDVLDRPVPPVSFERDLLPVLAEAGALRGQVGEGWIVDIGVPAELARARAELPRHLLRPALFLDRDGVVNVDHGYVGSQDRFEWIAGAKATIARATRAGWHVFVVTNQSGVARGFYDEHAVQTLHGWMQVEAMQAGGVIDDIRYCPDHPDAVVPRYRGTSPWRKPAPGMILDLLRAWEVAPGRALLIGDQDTDLAAAAAAGITGHRFRGGDLDHFVAPLLAGGAA